MPRIEPADATYLADHRCSDAVGRDIASRVLDAAEGFLCEFSYTELTLRAVAALAGVSSNDAVAHFASKDALVAELCLRSTRRMPWCSDMDQSPRKRVEDQLRKMVAQVAKQPGVAAACAVALMADEPNTRDLRKQIVTEVHLRIAAALGRGAWPEVAATLQMAYFGALVQAASRLDTYQRAGDRLQNIVGLILADLDG